MLVYPLKKCFVETQLECLKRNKEPKQEHKRSCLIQLLLFTAYGGLVEEIVHSFGGLYINILPFVYLSFISLIFPLTVRVVGAPQMISQPVSSIFPCSPLPSGTWRTPGLSIPWCCLPTPSSVCLVFSPPHFHCALQDGFVQT